VLLRSKLTVGQVSQLNAFVAGIASMGEDDSFWIVGQPFSMYLNEPSEEERKFSEPGWAPVQTVDFCSNVGDSQVICSWRYW